MWCRGCGSLVCAVRLKKVPIPKLSVTLSNINRFSKFLHCWKAYEICYKTYTHLTVGMLLHYLGKLKIQMYCRHSTDMEESANMCTNFNSSMHATVWWVYLCVFIKIWSSLLNTMLIVDKHCSDVCCDEFSVPQIDHKSKQVKEQWDEKFYLQSIWGKSRHFERRKYPNLLMNNKVWGFHMSRVSAENYIFNFPKVVQRHASGEARNFV